MNVQGNQLCVRDSAANEVVAQQRLKVMEASAFIDCDLHHGLPQGAIRKKVNGTIDNPSRRLRRAARAPDPESCRPRRSTYTHRVQRSFGDRRAAFVRRAEVRGDRRYGSPRLREFLARLGDTLDLDRPLTA